MTIQPTITADETRVPLASLTLSAMNPRQHVPEAEVVELAESILAAGLIQNLAGIESANGGTEIVAGGRRLRALQYLAEQHPDLATERPELMNPPVRIAPDATTAQAWAIAENAARRDLHPADEIRAYGKMEQSGATPAAIARAFAVSEKHVYRRLKLASLPAPIIDALAANEISLSAAACFTISDDEAHSLEVLARCRGEDWSDYQIKTTLKPDAVKDSDRRAVFVGLDAYKAAGGRVGGDLFANETLLDDPAILDEVFAKALADAADLHRRDGWKWVETITESYVGWYQIEQDKLARIYRAEGTLTEADAERYDELADLVNGDVLDEDGRAELETLQAALDGEWTDAQKAHAGLIVYVDQRGNLTASEGLVRHADKADAIAAGIMQGSRHTEADDAPKSPISAKLADDLSRVATGARQHALLRDPDLLLALLAYQLTGKMGYRHALGLRADDVPNLPTTEAEGYALDKRLTTPADRPADPFNSDLAKGFRAFRKKGAEHVVAELTRHLAALATIGDEKLGGLIDKEVTTDIRAVWTPTAANFFSRVGGPYLADLWRDLLDLAADDERATSFEKLKKGEKAAKLESLFADDATREAHGVTAAQAECIATWLPEGM